jgi:hypothetical protein
MVRVTQFKIRWYLVAVPIIGYLCAFPELAVLLGIFLAALAFVAPALAAVYFGGRLVHRAQGPSHPPI